MAAGNSNLSIDSEIEEEDELPCNTGGPLLNSPGKKLNLRVWQHLLRKRLLLMVASKRLAMMEIRLLYR